MGESSSSMRDALNAFEVRKLAPEDVDDATLFQLPGTELVSVPSADERGQTRKVQQGLQCEGVTSVEEFKRRYPLLDLRQQHPRTKPIPSGANFILGRTEPTGLGGLQRLWHLVEAIGLSLLSFLPSWLPRWDTPVHEGVVASAAIRARQRAFLPSPAVQVTACCWHPDKNLLALAIWRKAAGSPHASEEEHVVVYDFENGIFIKDGGAVVLRDANQTGISCIEWSPKRRNILAVGSKFGVCVWNITRGQSDYASVSVESQQPRSTGGKPQSEFDIRKAPPKLSCDSAITEVSAWMSLLQSPVGASWGPVHSLCYSPDGCQLAVTSGVDPNVIIWDTATEQPTLLRALVAGSTLVEWSPSGHFLFVATTTSKVLIWETQTWQSKAISGLDRPCQTACWGQVHSAEVLLLSVQGGEEIHALHLTSPAPFIDVSHQVIQETSSYTVQTPSRHLSLMGPIKQLAWDASTRRLAVIFDSVSSEAEQSASLVALYGVDMTKAPILLEPHGFLQAPPCSPPLQSMDHIAFARKFETRKGQNVEHRAKFGDLNSSTVASGALLAACWEGGCITFWPLYFKS